MLNIKAAGALAVGWSWWLFNKRADEMPLITIIKKDKRVSVSRLQTRGNVFLVSLWLFRPSVPGSIVEKVVIWHFLKGRGGLSIGANCQRQLTVVKSSCMGAAVWRDGWDWGFRGIKGLLQGGTSYSNLEQAWKPLHSPEVLMNSETPNQLWNEESPNRGNAKLL